MSDTLHYAAITARTEREMVEYLAIAAVHRAVDARVAPRARGAPRWVRCRGGKWSPGSAHPMHAPIRLTAGDWVH